MTRTFSDGTRHVVTGHGNRRIPARIRGKSAVKAAKRARRYDTHGRRIIDPRVL